MDSRWGTLKIRQFSLTPYMYRSRLDYLTCKSPGLLYSVWVVCWLIIRFYIVELKSQAQHLACLIQLKKGLRKSSIKRHLCLISALSIKLANKHRDKTPRLSEQNGLFIRGKTVCLFEANKKQATTTAKKRKTKTKKQNIYKYLHL